MFKPKTEEENRKFSKMSMPRKRVAIARDVLAAIALESIAPTTGAYFANDDVIPSEKDYSVRDFLPNAPVCNVCAKGALLLCAINIRNQVTVGDLSRPVERVWNSESLSKLLGGIFSAEQLTMIENEFEGYRVWHLTADEHFPVMNLTSARLEDVNFDRHKRGLTATERLTVIMKNIIKNKGTFTPIAPADMGYDRCTVSEVIKTWINEEV